jgi:hypothetical protein
VLPRSTYSFLISSIVNFTILATFYVPFGTGTVQVGEKGAPTAPTIIHTSRKAVYQHNTRTDPAHEASIWQQPRGVGHNKGLAQVSKIGRWTTL